MLVAVSHPALTLPRPRTHLISSNVIKRKIYFVRGQNVMLDSDLAELYDVPVRTLNQAVRRNSGRFPVDFMFQLSDHEARRLRSQSVILKTGRGRHRKYLPYAFTEQGVAMLSSVLRSKRAVDVNIGIMRTFVKIRALVSSHADVIRRLNKLEAEYDENFRVVFEAIERILRTPEPVRRRIGFGAGRTTCRP